MIFLLGCECLAHDLQGIGGGEPVLEGEDALVEEEGEAVGGFRALGFGEG